MADGITITTGTGITVATDDVGGVQHQYVKVEFGDDNTATKVTSTVGLPVQITSLPSLAVGSIVSVSGLTSASVTATNAGVFAVQVTSLPAFALGSIVSVSGLTSAIVSISNLPLSVSGSVAITSLPALTAASVTVSNLVSTVSTVTNAGIFAVQVTSLPNFAVGSIISVSGLTSAIVSISNLPLSVLSTVTNAGIFKVQVGANSNRWDITSTYTAAQTNVVLKDIAGSTTAYYITDIIFSNCSTQGNISLIESRSNAEIRVKIAPIYFTDYGGAISNFRIPIVLDTNAALCMTSQSVTSHSVTISGYTE